MSETNEKSPEYLKSVSNLRTRIFEDKEKKIVMAGMKQIMLKSVSRHLIIGIDTTLKEKLRIIPPMNGAIATIVS